MTKTGMTDARVLQLLQAYGAWPMAWPEHEREAAEAHLAAYPERFADALADARLLDSAFEAEPMPEPDPSLAARILADAPQPRTSRDSLGTRLSRILMPNGRRWPAGAALASLGMGLFAGYTASASSVPVSYETEAEAVVYAALGYDQYDTYLEEAPLDE
ncbi:hypothetical protein D1224_14890 [Henriciella barbarensis]|uniref:Uncharacterized protein n=1 Tax=Henriciella barbarensis TaxID=86342 RepID=A0A399QNE7_9PROT|nr:hypothetical protein [Henriciella barbarensis]RIJ20408.1 hypothetical protein D1224_14890 [Henriciella barbarensis]